MEPYVIAEIGSNCFKYKDARKNFALATQQIDAAKQCGADAVKFQLFTYKELYGVDGPEGAESPYALPKEWVPDLKEHCRSRRIEFMCSAFSVQGFYHLNPYVNTHKIASPEACFKPLVEAVMCMDNPVIVSNGCLTEDEQIQVIDNPLWGANDVLMECVSEYPANRRDYDLSKIHALASDYDILWGLSDHTKGSAVAIQALQLGASHFEKHVDLVASAAAKTPDSCVSMDFYDFERYVKDLKEYKKTEYDKKKRACKKLYGRTASGYRPLPHA